MVADDLAGRVVVLVTDAGAGKGGTDTYLHRLLRYYHSRSMRVILVTTPRHLDKSTEVLVRDLKFSCHHYDENMTGVSRIYRASFRAFGSDPRERSALNDPAILGDYDLLVASVGRPGRFLCAAAAARRSLYFLHTYPHGWKSQLFARWIMPHVVSSSTRIVTGSQFAARRLVEQWGLRNRADQVITAYYTAGMEMRPVESKFPRLVLTVAQVVQWKAPRDWIRAA